LAHLLVCRLPLEQTMEWGAHRSSGKQGMSSTLGASATFGSAHSLASPFGPREPGTGKPRGLGRELQEQQEHTKALYTSKTPLGGCFLDTVGHLKPCDDKHAPIRLYRSYGEWWEAGNRAPEDPKASPLKHSRYWPYGQDVTKLYQTEHRRHQYQLDQRLVSKAKPYIPPRNGSLPDLRMHRDARQMDMDLSYHASFNKDDPRFNMLGFTGGRSQEMAVPSSSRGEDRSLPPTGRSGGGASVGR